MEFLRTLFIFLATVKCIVSVPLIIDGPFITECTYNKTKLTNKWWTVKNRELLLHFNLCEFPTTVNQPPTCPNSNNLCLLDTKVQEVIDVGQKFIFESKNNAIQFRSVGGAKCRNDSNYEVIVKFSCSDADKLQPRLILGEDECIYEVLMMHPACVPHCTARIMDKLIDLRSLNQNIAVHTDNKTFHLTVCGPNSNCKENDVSSCEILSNGNVVVLSTVESQHVNYDLDKQELSIVGRYKVNKRFRKFELIMKCNWTANPFGNVTYRVPSTQGRNYVFNTESSYACIKTPTSCVATEDTLVYNISSLYRPSGWLVSNYSFGKMYINICGPLQLPTNNICSETFSQVCQENNNEFVNHGSISSDLNVANKKQLVLTINSGSTCHKNNSFLYSTHVKFECGSVEEGPSVISIQNCTTHLKWITPTACPTDNPLACVHTKPKSTDCKFTYNDAQYNMQQLKLNNSNYVVLDKSDSNVEFLINICGSVVAEEIPCMKDSMVIRKTLNEPHIKKKITSLGKIGKFEIINNRLQMSSIIGHYCADGSDYRAILYFDCHQQENITLVKKSKCNYEFEVKSPHACPIYVNATEKQCKFQFKDIKFDFVSMKQTSFRLVKENSSMTFDFCNQFYKNCNLGKCNNIPVQRNFMIVKEIPQVEILVTNSSCSGVNDFNKTIFRFVCDEISSNDHYENYTISNCELIVVAKTQLVCRKQQAKVDSENMKNVLFNITDHLSQESKEKKNYYEIASHLPKTNSADETQKSLPLAKEENIVPKKNCSLNSPYTGKIFVVNEFYPFHMLAAVDCPKVEYNKNNLTVKLTFNTSAECRATENKGPANSYEILLKCVDEKLKTELKTVKRTECTEFLNMSEPQVCQLFTNHDRTEKAIGFGFLNMLWILLGLPICFAGYWSFHYCRKRKDGSYSTIYCKDADL